MFGSVATLRTEQTSELKGQMDEEVESPPRHRAKIRQQRFNRVILVSTIITVVGVAIILYLIFGHTILLEGVHALAKLIRNKNPAAYFTLIMVQFVFAFVLFLPGLSTFNILQAYLIHDFWIAFALAFGGCYAGSLSVYLVSKACCKQSMYDRFSHTLVYKVLIKETHKRPYRSGILFNFLFIPVSVKNYLIGLSELKFYHCLVAFFPAHFILNAMCAMIGSKVNDLSEVFGSKSFSQKNRKEKIQFIISMALLAFTLAFLLMLFCVIKRQYSRYQEEEVKEEEEEEKKNPLVVNDSKAGIDGLSSNGLAASTASEPESIGAKILEV